MPIRLKASGVVSYSAYQIKRLLKMKAKRSLETSETTQLLPAFQVQVLIWTGDSGSNPERAHGDKFLDCQRPN